MAAQKTSPDVSEVSGLVSRYTNEFRREQGRGPVAVNPQLTEAGRHFAGHMAKTGELSHGADGATPAIRARRHGYDYCVISENIGYQYSSIGFGTRELAERFVEGWKSSAGHRKNLLDPDVTETGVAVAPGGRQGYYYAVQMFGRPASQAIRFSIANQSNTAVRYHTGGKSFTLAPRQTRAHTQCGSEELKLDLPGRPQGTTFAPKSGERLAIVRADSGDLVLRKE